MRSKTESSRRKLSFEAAYNSPNLVVRQIARQRYLLLMVVPAVVIIFLFSYLPMYGVIIAFKNYSIVKGVWGSPWAGFKWFRLFFDNPMWFRLMRNTLVLGFYSLLFGFPAPILLALLLNEIRNGGFKRVIQTISYLPHFISTVIIIGMLKEFASLDGLFNGVLARLGAEPILFFSELNWFRPLYVGSGIWQNLGWGAIIYLAALSGVDPELYESAIIDGAGRLRRAVSITIPSIMPTVTILFILRIGGILSADFQKVLLMYNPLLYAKADVIDTFVFREGILAARYSYATAIGLFLSVMALILTFTANFISRRVSGNSLW